MKIAILHEMLVKIWWAEKVVKELSSIFPQAPIYTLIYDEEKIWDFFWDTKIITTKITQKVYNLFKNQRYCLPFMSKAVESIDLSDYDIVIISSSWFAHWVITRPETKTVVYYHSPARYLWDRTFNYIKEIKWNKWIKKIILSNFLHKLRLWDFISSNRNDILLANSKNVQSRIKKYYKKDSQILYPPVEVDRFSKKIDKNFNKPFDEYYIIISALTEFKKIDIAIKAFNNISDKNLVIVWDWNYKSELEKIGNKNIVFEWAKYNDELVFLLQNSLWLIFPWEEDFWIVPIEALWAWKPVFAYNAWWLSETIKHWITWEFFYNQDWSDFIENFIKFDENIKNNKYQKDILSQEALKYSSSVFKEKIKKIVNNLI